MHASAVVAQINSGYDEFLAEWTVFGVFWQGSEAVRVGGGRLDASGVLYTYVYAGLVQRIGAQTYHLVCPLSSV